MKPKTYFCDLYKMNFIFHIGWNEKRFLDYAKKHYNFHPGEGAADGRTLELSHTDGSIAIVIWTRLKKASVIAHECIHATDATFELRGIPMKGEPLAYYVEKLVRKCLEDKK